MTTIETLKWDGKKSGKVKLDLAVAKETSSADLMHRAVLRQLANKRQGTASTLTRSEVRGGGRKPYKQKGTGRARQGSIRTPLRPGGGIIFGPKPRSYNLDMNRKERRLALRTAIMSRVSDIRAVEDFGSTLKQPKTSDIINGLLYQLVLSPLPLHVDDHMGSLHYLLLVAFFQAIFFFLLYLS